MGEREEGRGKEEEVKGGEGGSEKGLRGRGRGKGGSTGYEW